MSEDPSATPDTADDGYAVRLPTRRRIRWDAFEPSDRGVRIYYVVTGTVAGPNFDLDHVQVEEGPDEVHIRLFELVTASSEKLAAVHQCVDVVLEEPLGERRCADGDSNAPAHRLNRSATPESSDWRDWFHARAKEKLGCRSWPPML